MATSSFVEKIRVNNSKVLEDYVVAMETAIESPVIIKSKRKAVIIKNSQEARELMLKGIMNGKKK